MSTANTGITPTVIKIGRPAPPVITILSALAMHRDAHENCQIRPPLDPRWAWQHKEFVDQICKDLLPSGSGIDCGTKFNWDLSRKDRLIFDTSFHHMNDVGMYDGWTEHTIVVKPAFVGGFDINVTGRNKNQIKEYLADTYYYAFQQKVQFNVETETYVVVADRLETVK